MASSSASNRQLFVNGSITKLFSFQMSVVVLMDYSETQETSFLGMGQFVLYLMLHTTYPILVTACSVDAFHWPLAKDTVVFRMAKRTFAFALPGLLYGLQFPDFCDDALLDQLERLFIRFGHYFKVIEDRALGYSLIDNEPLLWYKLRRRLEPMAHEMVGRVGQLGGKSRFSVCNRNPTALRAIRMSATTKLAVDVMVKTGRLRESHMVQSGANPSPHLSTELMAHHTAHASVGAFASIVDTLEHNDVISAGRADHVMGLEPPVRPGFVELGFKVWKFSEVGVVAFMRDVEQAVEEELQMMREKEEKWRARERELAGASSSGGAAGAGPSADAMP